MTDAPKPEGDAQGAIESASTLAKFQEIDDALADIRQEDAYLSKKIDFVSDTNRFIIVVLFATFLVIIVAIGLAIMAGHKVTIKL